MRELGINRPLTGPRPKGSRLAQVSLSLGPPFLQRDSPNELWLTDIERHEALCDRAVMKGHRRHARRSGLAEAEGSLSHETVVRVDSSPDNNRTGQDRGSGLGPADK